MKIISTFSDYYDGLQSYDASNGVYERATKELPVDWMGYGYSVSGVERSIEFKTGIVGFCGKLYPYIRYKNTLPNPNYHCLGNCFVDEYITTTEFIYNFEDFDACRKDVETIKVRRYHWIGGWKNSIMRGWKKDDKAKLWFEQDWNTLLSKRENQWGGNGKTPVFINPLDMFIEHKVPYFVLEHTGIEGSATKGDAIILNPKLTDYGFQRIFDAYTCYQEIEMFMNNQIVRPDDPYIEPVSDKLKAEAHGFNAESFRKPKGKKKRR